MLKLGDLVIDPKSLGAKLWLTEITPVYEYRDNKRTENIFGYRYIITLPDKGFEKIGVKIDGKQIIDPPESGYKEVTFQNLEIFVYILNGQPTVAAKATNISIVNSKS
jgi:hypothetical protein